jgi:hypothetical protein
MRTVPKGLQIVLWTAAVVVLGALYVHGARRHLHEVNTSMENTDQGSYLEYAVNMRETGYAYVGGRNQMPLYPFLQSLAIRSDAPLDQIFVRSKALNIILSIVLLAALFLVWRRQFPLVQATALLLVTAFTVFLFRAAYVQVELFYYTLAFGSFLFLCRMLEAPSWRIALMAGGWLGLTHLAKASVLPGIALFVLLGLLRAGWLAFRRSRETASPGEERLRVLGREAARVGLVVLAFVVTISPYLMTSKRVFGRAFYNVNSTFYMWYDTWADAMQGTIAHGDRVGWPSLPREQLPGPAKYLRDHSLKDVAVRLDDGLRFLFGRAVRTYGYWKYVVFYGAVALIILAMNWRWSVGMLRKHPFVVLFGLGYFVGYVLLYAWYVPIARGNRLVLALFLPFMFAVGAILYARARAERTGDTGPFPRWFKAVHLVLIGGIALELYDILSHRIVTMYAGD